MQEVVEKSADVLRQNLKLARDDVIGVFVMCENHTARRKMKANTVAAAVSGLGQC